MKKTPIDSIFVLTSTNFMTSTPNLILRRRLLMNDVFYHENCQKVWAKAVSRIITRSWTKKTVHVAELPERKRNSNTLSSDWVTGKIRSHYHTTFSFSPAEKVSLSKSGEKFSAKDAASSLPKKNENNPKLCTGRCRNFQFQSEISPENVSAQIDDQS